MKFKEWIEFNKPFIDNKKLIVSVFKNGSRKADDVVMKTLIDLDSCDGIFGSLEMVSFRESAITRPDDGYRVPAIGVILWTNECPDEDKVNKK